VSEGRRRPRWTGRAGREIAVGEILAVELEEPEDPKVVWNDERGESKP
jgi:hypothetical protein